MLPALTVRLSLPFSRAWAPLAVCAVGLAATAAAQSQGEPLAYDPALQVAENPPMQIITRAAPPLPEPTDDFEVRDGFTLIETLDQFRAAIKQDHQKIRLKPGHYVADGLDEPVTFTKLRPVPEGRDRTSTQEQVFAITGSNSHFDLRGVVFTIPSSLKHKLTRKTHMADNWRVSGSHNVIEGAYFRTDVDLPYPEFFSGGNMVEVVNDGNTFLDCTFHVKGSIPYGYTDYYGKGRERWTKLDKHSFMSLEDANNTTLRGCKIYNHSFGHALHLHKTDGVLVEECFFTGALRHTSDIFKEKVGPAREHKFNIMYRGQRPIPRNEVIPLTEDAIRAYNEVKNVVVRNTTVERQRGCVQLLCPGDVTLENVTVREAGDFAYDLTAGKQGKVVMKNCFADLAYNPVFNLTRGELPYKAHYEVTILSPAEGVKPTPRTSLGVICGERSGFVLHDGTTTKLRRSANVLTAGGRKPLKNSEVRNYTRAAIVLEKNVENCTIRSIGPVKDNGKNNTIIRLRPGTTAESDKV